MLGRMTRLTVTTTVTTTFEPDGSGVEHALAINSEDEMPRSIAMAAALGGLRSSARSLEHSIEAETDGQQED